MTDRSYSKAQKREMHSRENDRLQKATGDRGTRHGAALLYTLKLSLKSTTSVAFIVVFSAIRYE